MGEGRPRAPWGEHQEEAGKRTPPLHLHFPIMFSRCLLMYHSLTISHCEKHNPSRKVDIIIALNHFTIYLNGSTWEAWPGQARCLQGKSSAVMRYEVCLWWIRYYTCQWLRTAPRIFLLTGFFFFSIAKELRQSTINPVNEALKITVCPLGDKTVTNPIFLAGRDPDFLVTSGDGGPCITDEALCSVLSVTSFSAFV